MARNKIAQYKLHQQHEILFCSKWALLRHRGQPHKVEQNFFKVFHEGDREQDVGSLVFVLRKWMWISSKMLMGLVWKKKKLCKGQIPE